MMCIGQERELEVMKKFSVGFLFAVLVSTPLLAQVNVGLNDFHRFEHRGDETVFDRATQLTWQTCSLGQQVDKEFGCGKFISTINWNAAKKIDLPGWRLPTKDELVTLIERYSNENKSSTRINTSVFYRANKGQLNYWTSDSAGEHEAWYVSFGTGPIAEKADKNSQFAVRLVKGTFVPPAPEARPPKDINDFIGWRDDCNHFAGEFNGDQSNRDQELGQTMSELRCDKLDAAEKKLRKKYQGKPDMLKWLEDNQKWPR
jgi:hypothetical protein